MWHRAVAVIALASGCGRLGFDAGGADAAGDAATGCWGAWHAGTIAFGAPRAMPELGLGGGATGDPSLSADGLALYVTHDAGAGFDPYVAVRPTTGAPFGAAVPVAALDSPDDEYRVTVTGDHLTAVVSSARDVSAGQDLWLATRAAPTDEFAPPSQALVALLNTSADEFDPEITADGKRLYFAPYTTPGAQRIAVADRPDATSAFGAPVELTELALGAITADPSLSPDQTVILFAAHDQPAAPQLHYAVRPDADGTFGAARAITGLGPPGVRFSDGEVALDGCAIYFTSDLGGGYGVFEARAL